MKVAICGTVPASRMLAPFDDHEWQIWGCSPGNRGQLPRVTTWFELHGIYDLLGKENDAWRFDYFKYLNEQKFPIYMQERNPHVPGAIVFPRDILIEKFGRNWFTSSIAWMMAYAIHLGATEIGLFGVDMAATEEHYSAQKAGCRRFIEIAEERGIKVFIPLESCLGAPFPMYGYAEATRFGRRLLVRMNETKQVIAGMEAQVAKLQNEIAYAKGALEDMGYMQRTFVNGYEDAEIGPLDPVLPTPIRPDVPGMSEFTRSPDSALLVPPKKARATGG